jgi:hypothetical protein
MFAGTRTRGVPADKSHKFARMHAQFSFPNSSVSVDIFVPTYFGGSPDLPTLNIAGAISVLNETALNLLK